MLENDTQKFLEGHCECPVCDEFVTEESMDNYCPFCLKHCLFVPTIPIESFFMERRYAQAFVILYNFPAHRDLDQLRKAYEREQTENNRRFREECENHE